MPSKKSNCVDCNSLCSPGHLRCRNCSDLHKKKRARRFCVDCDKEISRRAKRCTSCSNKYNGNGVKRNYCVDCGKVLVDNRSERCSSCSSKGNRNGQWKGDRVGYIAVHDWVKRYKPKPEFCEECNKKRPIDLANISGEYKRDVNDFEWLCRKCHMEKDGRLKSLLKNGTKSRIRKKHRGLFQCKKCKKFKRKSSFNINKHSKDGLEYSCRQCYKGINKIKNQRNRIRRIKTKMRKCSICKENKPDGQVDLQYGKMICGECLPKFEKDAKKEVTKKIEELI